MSPGQTTLPARGNGGERPGGRSPSWLSLVVLRFAAGHARRRHIDVRVAGPTLVGLEGGGDADPLVGPDRVRDVTHHRDAAVVAHEAPLEAVGRLEGRRDGPGAVRHGPAMAAGERVVRRLGLHAGLL